MPSWSPSPRATPALTADVIVVGAGAAGCALAARLVELTEWRVLLVEDGAWAHDPLVHVPKGFVQTMQRRSLTHRYEAVPQDVGPIETWLRGRGVGGSTLVNGTMWLRGERHLHDRLAASLGEHWAWEGWRAAYEHLETVLPVTVGPIDGEVPRLMLDALGHGGLRVVADPRRASGARAAPVCATVSGGRRATAGRLLRPGMRDGRLRVLAEQRALRVVVEGSAPARATGVTVRTQRGEVVTHRALRAVVCCAGALESPLLLERSGIGDPEVLADAGIPSLVANPAVGEGLREQRAVTVKARVRDGLGHNHRLTGPGLTREVARYLTSRRGPLATGPYDLAATIATDGSDPDVQLLLAQLSTDASGLAPAAHAGVMMQGYPLRPTSTGSVHVGDAPEAPPRVRAPLVTTAVDRATAARALAAARAVLATEPLRSIVIREELPGDAVPAADASAAGDFARDSGSGIFHAVGTCAAGTGGDSALDPGLRVRGVDGLRVADLSALPWHPSGGTGAVAMALGRLAAGWMVADAAVDAAAARPFPRAGRHWRGRGRSRSAG